MSVVFKITNKKNTTSNLNISFTFFFAWSSEECLFLYFIIVNNMHNFKNVEEIVWETSEYWAYLHIKAVDWVWQVQVQTQVFYFVNPTFLDLP